MNISFPETIVVMFGNKTIVYDTYNGLKTIIQNI
jgi:hypothetical protein